jgi:glycosyltransferase involved in cell wall biosynthesis
VRRPLRVLQSFPEPRPTTNPYVVMLRGALDALPGAEVLTFSWGRALAGRYDVFHVHWPEILLSGRDPLRRAVRRVLVAALLLRLRVTGTPVVRTAHNLAPHAGVSPVEAFLLRGLDRRTAVVVRLNDQTPVPRGTPARTVLHGHYRDWFAAHHRPERTPHRVAFVGLIRPYKNVEALVAAFAEVAERAPQASLHVAGQPTGADLDAALRRAAGDLPQVSLELTHLSDERLVQVVAAAELVVLPYREMHNSGAALLALSMDRPVLVPDNEVTGQLAEEVGPGWVLRYDGELSADRLVAALEEARRLPPGARPDLGRREWATAGRDHLAAYEEALARSRRRRSERTS